MALDITQAIEVLKTPKYTSEINAAKFQESQLRVFTENLNENELRCEPYFKEMLKTIKTRSESKYERVLQFFRYPLPIVQISDDILNDYFKLFEGKNRNISVNGSNDVKALKNWLNENDVEKWIEQNMRSVLTNKPNSFVVVDIKNGNPYLLNIGSERLIDVEFKNKFGDVEYIAFVHSIKKKENQVEVNGQSTIYTKYYAVYDEENYFVISKDSNSDEYVEVSSQKHNIGYCPAKSFVSSSVNKKNLFQRRVAFSGSLSRMEDYTIFDVFRNYVDHYAPFPVTESPEKPCKNTDCIDGKVKEEVFVSNSSNEKKTIYNDCPVCNGGKNRGQHIGPGLHIGIEPSMNKDQNDASGYFRMIFPDVDKLEYVPKKLDGIVAELKNHIVGVNKMVEKEAVNELQAKGGFDSMESVVVRNKREPEIIHKWIIETVSKILYRTTKVSVEVNYGTEWFLLTEDELQTRYDNAKKIGLPIEEVLNIYKQLIGTKYKNNPEKLKREMMLLDLDLYPMYSIKECIELKKESILDDFQLSFKVNFQRFISMFESKNIEITMFGVSLPYWKRIEAIQKSLYLYNQELIDEKNDRNSSKTES